MFQINFFFANLSTNTINSYSIGIHVQYTMYMYQSAKYANKKRRGEKFIHSSFSAVLVLCYAMLALYAEKGYSIDNFVGAKNWRPMHKHMEMCVRGEWNQMVFVACAAHVNSMVTYTFTLTHTRTNPWHMCS